MDLNSLLSEHQIALIRADQHAGAGQSPDRAAISALSERIRRLRGLLGVAHYEPDLAGGAA